MRKLMMACALLLGGGSVWAQSNVQVSDTMCYVDVPGKLHYVLCDDLLKGQYVEKIDGGYQLTEKAIDVGDDLIHLVLRAEAKQPLLVRVLQESADEPGVLVENQTAGVWDKGERAAGSFCVTEKGADKTCNYNTHELEGDTRIQEVGGTSYCGWVLDDIVEGAIATGECFGKRFAVKAVANPHTK